MALEDVLEMIKQQAWIDAPAGKLQDLVRNVYDSLEPKTSVSIRNFLHGKWLAHPLHPALTDVPIGAWTGALLLDTMDSAGERRGIEVAADTLIAAGLVGASGAALAGVTDWYKLRGDSSRRIGAAHAGLNITATLLYGTSLLLRVNGQRGAGKVFGALGYGVTAVSAWLGGDLAFERTIGMNHTADLQPPKDFMAVLPDVDLPQRELRRVEANEVPVLLYRDGERIYAMIETCAHLGGPLAEGHVHDGTVACPWHGSRFELTTGEVVEGPAVYDQPYLETRVREGQVEVKIQ